MNYEGRYAQITADNVSITDKTNLSAEDTGFNSKLKGFLVKVGHEVDGDRVRIMYIRIYNMPTITYILPLSFGNMNKSNILWSPHVGAVVDTRCAITTFDLSVFK